MFAQQVFTLHLAHFFLGAGLYLLAELEYFQLVSKITAEIFQLGANGIEFEQFLTQFQLHLHEGGYDIDDLARLFEIERGGGYPFRDVLYKGNQALEVADDIAFNSLCLFVVFLHIRFERHVGGKVRFLLRKLADVYALQALDNNLDCAIGHADHTSNTRDGAYPVDIVGSCLLCLG